jgi:hypothetical protein
MYQQHGISWPGQLRGPRVGIGALAFGMAAAFVAGGIVVSLVAGSYLAVPPAAIGSGAQNHTPRSETFLTRELLVDDVVPVPAARNGPALTRDRTALLELAAEASRPTSRELLVDDFVSVPAPHRVPATRSETFFTRELLVDDSVPVPAPRSGTPPLRLLGLSGD